MFKNIAVAIWILTIGSLLWLLGKANPVSLFLDWVNYITILVTGIFAGNALSRMITIPSSAPEWKSLSKMAFAFYVGILCVVVGVLFSATKFLGSQWPGFPLALFGICYYQLVLSRVGFLYKKLSA